MAVVTTTAKKLPLLAVVAAAFALPAAAQAATITSTTPFEADVTACNGDTIHLSGQLLSVISVTFDAAGGAMFSSHFQPQGISGVDLQTGTKYLGTGLTRDISVFAASGTTTITSINRFHIQATAGADSFDVSETFHVTFLADGSVTAFVDNFSRACS
jgi:hypothetical protein